MQAQIADLERATARNPCLLESWRVLEALYRSSGRDGDAERAAGQITQLTALPEEIRAACSHYYEGEVAAAEDLVRKYLATHAEHVEALRLLAKIAADAGAHYDADLLLQRAVSLVPDHEAARHELAQVLLKRQKHEAARAHLAQLLLRAPDNHAYRALYARVAAAMGDYSKALPLFNELLGRGGRDPELYLSVGDALKTVGKTAEAIDSYRLAAVSPAGFGMACWSLANLKTFRFTEVEISLMQERERTATLPEDRYHLCFALGKALEDGGRFAESFAYYERGNALKRATLRYQPESLERTARLQAGFCTREFFEMRAGFGSDSTAPIFIVGLPRSGSTLVEQILASHSQVDGTMELADIPRLAQELQSSERAASLGYPGILGALSGPMCRALGERYLRETTVYRTGKPRFTDKMPNNFQYLDLVQLILPDAKVIDVRREPMACGFGIFKQLFANGQRFAYTLEDIARYYRAYVGLMEHWERALPGKILRVQYEDLVEDPGASVRGILDFCGLEFEPECVEFHRRRRSVHTPSSEQVHQPLYRDGLEHWRHYERWLTPLRRALGS